MNVPTDHNRQIALVAAMSRSAFYSHASDPEIRLVQTHLSYVLLTGPYAYKINKCIRFSFVDYSTLAKRRHFCEEEIRLNRLYAPDLYLDVVPLYQGAEEFSMSPCNGNEPVEFAVRMHQFRDEDLLQHVFERGELTKDDVDYIACRLARFHREAKNSPEISAYGSPTTVAAMVQENYESLAAFTGALWPDEKTGELRQFTDRVLRDQADLLTQRAEQGRIRECHGDLHLGNICYYNGRIEFFDRVVFNETFKNIDVMYDLAFLYMDFEYRGRPDMANRLLNAYLEESNDFEGVRLLQFYACCRAQIRSKVFAIESSEEEIPTADRPALQDEANAYLELALRYAADPQLGSVTLMCGVSGSGKSTVARELSARSGAVRIRSDTVRKHFADHATRGQATDIYSAEMTQRTYAFLIEEGARLAACGYPVVLDATFSERTLRQQAIAECLAQGVTARILHCVADSATLHRRVESRTGDVSDADVSVLERQLNTFDDFDSAERTNVVEVDTTQPIDYAELLSR